MKITLKKTPEHVELLKAMASRDPMVRMEANNAFAEFVGPVMATVVNNAPVLSNLYSALPSFDAETPPTVPLELFSDITDTDYLHVWSQTAEGGLGTNEFKPATQEMFMQTYNLTSAWSFDKKHVAKSRLDVVSKALTRVAQEILFKQENYAAGPLFSSLANAETNGRKHVMRTRVAGRFLMDDLNDMITRMRRINTSFNQGTPIGGQGKLTDIFFSPEAEQELRSMAYNAINTKTAPQTSAIKDSVAAPESIRAQMFDSVGVPNFFNISFHSYNEFGVGTDKRFNLTFDVAAGSTSYADFEGGNGAAFDGSTSQVMLALDRTRDSLLKATVQDEYGADFSFSTDDQFNVYGSRAQQKFGMHGGLTEARVVLDTRALLGYVM